MQQGMAKLMGADIVQHVLRRLRADDDDANPAVFHVQPVHLLQLCIGYLDAAELRQVEGIAGIMAFYQFPDTLFYLFFLHKHFPLKKNDTGDGF